MRAQTTAQPAATTPRIPSLARQLRELDERPGAALLIRLDGRIVYANTALEELFGYAPGELNGLGLDVLKPAHLRGADLPGFLQLLAAEQNGGVMHYRCEGLHKNGSSFAIDVGMEPITTSRGRLIRCVTRETPAGEQHAQRSLDGSWQVLIDELPVSLFAVDAGGRIVGANAAANRLFGYHEDELRGRSIVELLHDKGEFEQRAAHVREHGDGASTDGYDVVLAHSRLSPNVAHRWSYVRKDGGHLPVALTIKPRLDMQGKVTGYIQLAEPVDAQSPGMSIEHLAHHDALTGLPNRALLGDRMRVALNQAQRRNGRLAVMMIDLDRFKSINDTFGHAVGDELLKTVAMRLRACVRKSDTVARLGGDEFVLLFPSVSDRAELEVVTDNILGSISATMFLGGHEIAVTPSIGASLYPDDAADEGALMKCADTAMYHAKHAGRANAKWFDSTMQAQAQAGVAATARLRRSIRNGELDLHYQPEISLRSGAVLGVEALLRWSHPTEGLIPAERFIDAAEHSGFGVQFARWLLRKACRDCRELEATLGHPIALAVNLSTRQFLSLDLPALLREALSASGLPPGRLQIEVTEETLTSSFDRSAVILRKLREVGVTVTIDNFGAGHGALSCLSGLPIDRIKISRSLITQLPLPSARRAMIDAIIAAAYSLDLEVCAVGVETRSQQSFLQERGCLAAQGSYYAEAAPASRIADLVQSASRRLLEPA